MLVKLENDKRIAGVLNLMQKKQDQIDELIKEKRQMEGELEAVWQATSAENRRLKDAFLDIKQKRPVSDHITLTSANYQRLLLDD